MSAIVEADPATIERAAALIAAGEVVACPTETRYGLAADAANAAAVARVLAIKERPVSQAIPVLVADRPMLELLVEGVVERAEALIEAHWPGPLTLVLRARPGLPPGVCADGWVGVRMSSDPVASALVRAVGAPIAATSANVSGDEAAISAREAALPGVSLTLDGGTRDRLASTVARVDAGGVVVLRRGGVQL